MDDCEDVERFRFLIFIVVLISMICILCAGAVQGTRKMMLLQDIFTQVNLYKIDGIVCDSDIGSIDRETRMKAKYPALNDVNYFESDTAIDLKYKDYKFSIRKVDS